MIINILAGGPITELPDLTPYTEENSIWVGVDRGVLTLLKKGIIPSIAFGDFDSVTAEEFQYIKDKTKRLNVYQSEKDEPDLELALEWAKSQQPENIRLFGATGGRLDHFFANVQLLMKANLEEYHVEIIDKQNHLTAKAPGSYEIEKFEERKYISFVPISSSVENLTLQGFKYPLKNHYLPQYSALCISNELIDKQGHFSFTKGILLVVRSND